ncbi:putative lipid II flippase FtsW [Arthrobacter roseus]|uniref:putative lipid II flippase FtsW n=1 Tax=Arthrobacter roseus TaxID=136274 RepID=UPI001963B186|nr:putative lipid II flippase FtsW [Arthrobacter roseus]MBM7848333.1 cell division protein FtsW [Arthrobacter roseus]
MVTTPKGHTGKKPRVVMHPKPRTHQPSTVNAPSSDVAPQEPPANPNIFKRIVSRVEGRGKASSGSAYYMILGATLALTAIGLMMVLSASSVEAIAEETNTFKLFLKQSVFAAMGIILMLLLSRTGKRFYTAIAWPSLIGAWVLLALVQIVGKNVGGNKNWIDIAGITFQPSEPTKLVLALWCATVLARKAGLVRHPMHALIPVLPLGGLAILLVLIGGDLGTAMILMLIVVAAVFFAGAPVKIFALAGLAGAVASVALVILSPNRSGRIQSWLRLNCDLASDPCLQATNGFKAMASGGWWGVGIFQSRQKWNWIPEAHNDFIFTIIGEEFGLIGTTIVVALFAALAIAGIRVTLRHTDPFVRILGGSILVWLIGQAFVNIAVVTGVLPVVGVPLPFISYGGSALTFSLAAVGVLLSFARKIPESETTSA